MASDKPNQDDPAQSQRFIDMAEEVGSTKDFSRFAALFEEVTKPKVSHATQAETGFAGDESK